MPVMQSVCGSFGAVLSVLDGTATRPRRGRDERDSQHRADQKVFRRVTREEPIKVVEDRCNEVPDVDQSNDRRPPGEPEAHCLSAGWQTSAAGRVPRARLGDPSRPSEAA